MRKLPSIKLLVTFESAARNLSFKDAAKELFVTPSAVSHQVRTLEEALNTTLFVRNNRSIELTEEGRSYFKQISQAIRTIYSATENLIDRGAEKTLLIHSIPYLTNTFIASNIKTFKSMHPDLKISIESRIERAQLTEPHRNELQVGLRHGCEENDEFQCDEICPISISPLCSKNYPLGKALTQIQLTTDKESWLKWQSDWGTTIEFSDTLSCDSAQAVVELTEQGLGLAMGYFPLVSHKVNSGDLVLAFPEKVSQLESLYLVYPKRNAGDPIIESLVDWLRAMIQIEDR